MSQNVLYVQGLTWKLNNELGDACGSDQLWVPDQRLGLFRVADEAEAWAKRCGHDAYQLRKGDPYALHANATRPVGCVMVLNPTSPYLKSELDASQAETTSGEI